MTTALSRLVMTIDLARHALSQEGGKMSNTSSFLSDLLVLFFALKSREYK